VQIGDKFQTIKRRFNMPRMDRTGPFGTGPVGKGLGPCGGGFAYQRGGGWGTGRDFRWGGGPGWWSAPAVSTEEEKALLEQWKNCLKTQLEAVEKRLEKLKKPEE
jgi:hypothetical protein